jgi:hypothetical protein
MNEYLRESRRWETAVLLTVPLFVIYELGLLLFSDGSIRNAADVFLTREIFRLHGRAGPLLLNLVVLLIFIAAATRGRARLAPGLLALVVVESSLWALILPLLTVAIDHLSLLSVPGVADVALRIGAGLYEEILFRLIVLAGGFTLLHRGLRVDPIWATVTALIGSALAFSIFHHVGPLGEPWTAPRFVFRFLAGTCLGLIFVFRGLAVTCWTHSLYNVFILMF